jgi:hypothetical protein
MEISQPHQTRCLFLCGLKRISSLQLLKFAIPSSFSNYLSHGALLNAKQAGASYIYAIDINPAKFPIAMEWGADECLNPKVKLNA